MEATRLLRLEGLAVLCLSLIAYVMIGWPLWLLVVLALAPDLSMLGYVAGSTIGCRVYNAFHTYSCPLALGGAGVWLGVDAALLIATVWIGHIGADRALGYGLKHERGFHETHLGRIGGPM